jgi:acetyl-CoA carboxylase carboxyltransferase component
MDMTASGYPLTPTMTTPINPLRELVETFRSAEAQIRLGGGHKAIDRQHEKGRLTARERVTALRLRHGCRGRA